MRGREKSDNTRVERKRGRRKVTRERENRVEREEI